jgi:putative hydrolase of the HAD superfamily
MQLFSPKRFSMPPQRDQNVRPIRAVLFDLYGTLAGFDPPRERIQSMAAERHGLTLDVGAIPGGYREADDFMAAQNATAPLREMSPAARGGFFARYEQIILRHAGADVDEATASAVWETVRRQKYGLAPYPDVIPVLEELRKSGRTIGVVSNMAEPGDAVAARVGLTEHIDFVVTSQDAGANKPHPPIFLEALAHAAAGAEEALLVGDSLEADIDGARGVGIQAVFMDRDGHYPDYSGGPRITGMSQLMAIIEELECG